MTNNKQTKSDIVRTLGYTSLDRLKEALQDDERFSFSDLWALYSWAVERTREQIVGGTKYIENHEWRDRCEILLVVTNDEMDRRISAVD